MNQEDLNCIGEGQHVGVWVCVRGTNMCSVWYWVGTENEEANVKYAKRRFGKFLSNFFFFEFEQVGVSKLNGKCDVIWEPI